MNAGTFRRMREALQLWDHETLVAAVDSAKPGSVLDEAVRGELANRGLNRNGDWIGFPQARCEWFGEPADHPGNRATDTDSNGGTK